MPYSEDRCAANQGVPHPGPNEHQYSGAPSVHRPSSHWHHFRVPHVDHDVSTQTVDPSVPDGMQYEHHSPNWRKYGALQPPVPSQ
ncbi:MAG: hypothetical protein CMJ18_12790 [Phycisphaeraceae bacterium]|nr:hypothetical protein [Phycisphaeraceae bacterium]